MVSSYCYNYGINGTICRFANIVGSRSNHGVIFDFIKKLKNNSQELEVLGDGKQSKSYVHVNDCVDGFFFGALNKKEKVDIFNIGNADVTNVLDIANITTKVMNLRDVKIIITGGVDGGRGWKGDVKMMKLNISKIKKLGWKNKYNSLKAVETSIRETLK